MEHLRASLGTLAVMSASILVGLNQAFTGAALDTMRNTVKDGPSKLSLPDDSDLWVFRGDGGNQNVMASWFSGLFAIGCVFGALIGYPLSDRFGRKMAVLLTVPFYAAGLAVISTCSKPGLLILGRILSGVGAGCACVAVPTYIGETAPTSIRGILGAGHQLGIAFGAMLSYLMADYVRTGADGYYISDLSAAKSNAFANWRRIAEYSQILVGVMCLAVLFVPETPRWLAAHGKIDQAKKVLANLRGGELTVEEVESLEKVAAQSAKKKKVTYADLKSNRKQLFVGIGIHLLQQAAAVQAFNFYLSTMLQEAGIKKKGTVSFIAMILKFAVTFILVVFIDRHGRRPFLLIGSFLMSASCVTMGLGYYFQENGSMVNNAVFEVAAYVFCAAYGLGVGPIPWLLMSELFEDKIRAVASSWASAVNWLTCFAITQSFFPLTEYINYSGTLWVYAGGGAGLFIFTLLFLPETKGKTFEEIKAHFNGKEMPPVKGEGEALVSKLGSTSAGVNVENGVPARASYPTDTLRSLDPLLDKDKN